MWGDPMVLFASGGFLWGAYFSDFVTPKNASLVYAVLLFLIILSLSLLYKFSLRSVEEEVVPSDRFGLKNILQYATESLLNLVNSLIPHHGEKYLPLIASIFLYLFFANLLGLIPGFAAPSMSFSGNLAVGFIIFLYYNYVGARRAGLKNYILHFFGPSLGPAWPMIALRVFFLAPLIFGIEIVSHCARPLTLSLRLLANMVGDHLVLGTFSELIPLVVPVAFLVLGLFVSFVQAFVFALLSGVYIGLAVETEAH